MPWTELIIALFAPLQWAGPPGSPGGPHSSAAPAAAWPPREDHRKLRPWLPDNKAFYFGSCQDGKLVRLIRKISSARFELGKEEEKGEGKRGLGGILPPL